MSLKGGTNRPELVSLAPWPDWCAPLIGSFELTITHLVDRNLRFIVPVEKLRGAVTFAVPAHGAEWDRGITWKRMEESTKRIRELRPKGMLGVPRALAAIVHPYTTTPSSAVPEDLDHPRYKNNAGGAWNILDYLPQRGECRRLRASPSRCCVRSDGRGTSRG